MATTNKNFKVKNGLEVANAIGVGATPSFGTAGQILVSAGSNAAPTWEDPSAGGGGISNVVEDTTPQLGGDLDAQGYDITNLNSLTFDTTPTSPGTAAGTIYWDDGDGVPKAILNANVTVGVNQELILKVKNATGTTITKGSVVYINGAQGQNPTIALANATTEVMSSKTFGFTAEAIIDGAEGFLIAEGIFRGANTDGLVEGDPIYLSTTAGQYTQTIPAEPAHSVFLGYVVKAHASAGEIIVKIQNGYELTELHGVTIANTAATNDILQLNSSGIWVNANLATAGIANLSGATFTGNVAGTNANLSGNVNAVTVNATTLRLTSTTEAAFDSTDHALQIGPTDGVNLRMDPNEISRFNNGVPATLVINPDGGPVIVGQFVATDFTVNGNTISNTLSLYAAEKQTEYDTGVTGSSTAGGYVYANNTHYINVASSNYFANITPQRVYPTGWTQEDFGSGGTLTANTVTVTGIWTGAAEGDIVVIFASTENAAYPTTSSAGWSSQNSGSTTYAATLFWKRMGATPDTSMVLTFTGSTTPSSYVAKRFRPTGITPSLSTAVVTVQTSAWTVGTTTTPNPAAISTVYPNAIAVTAISVENTNSGGTATVVPTGYSNSASGLQERYSYLSSTSASYSGMTWKSTPIASAGTSEDASAWTISAGAGGGTPTWSATTFLVQAYVDPIISLINTSFLSSGSFNSSTYVLHINNTSASTLSWSGATFAWQGGTAPTLSSTVPNNIVILETVDGSTFRGAALTSYA